MSVVAKKNRKISIFPNRAEIRSPKRRNWLDQVERDDQAKCEYLYILSTKLCSCKMSKTITKFMFPNRWEGWSYSISTSDMQIKRITTAESEPNISWSHGFRFQVEKFGCQPKKWKNVHVSEPIRNRITSYSTPLLYIQISMEAFPVFIGWPSQAILERKQTLIISTKILAMRNSEAGAS